MGRLGAAKQMSESWKDSLLRKFLHNKTKDGTRKVLAPKGAVEVNGEVFLPSGCEIGPCATDSPYEGWWNRSADPNMRRMDSGHALDVLREWLRLDDGLSAEKVSALQAAVEAIQNPLLAFIREEVPFRLKEVLWLPEEQITSDVIEECIDRLWNNTDVMFDYDGMDRFLEDTVSELTKEDGQ